MNKVKSAISSETPLRLNLPMSDTTEYREGQKIYGEGNPSKGIYSVVTGTVEISQTTEGASGALVEIIRPDELFGESAFLKCPYPAEQATALESTTVMTWAISDVRDVILKRPQVGAALVRLFAQRNAEIRRRIECLSLDTIEWRLARSLIRLSERLGTPEGDGYVRVMPLTDEMLERYVGASSEIVAQYMNRFQKQGYVSYSRGGIVLYRAAFQKFLYKTAQRRT